MEVRGLISDLAFILLLGALVTLLFKWIKQPVVLGYIVAGFLASPHFEYLPSVTTEANIDFSDLSSVSANSSIRAALPL